MQFKLATWIPFSFGLLSAAMLLPWPDAADAQHAASAHLRASDLANPDVGVDLPPPRYLQSRSARFIDWLADGSMLGATRFGEPEQVHRVRSPLSMREQLSFEPAGVMAAAAEPEHSDALVFLSPRA